MKNSNTYALSEFLAKHLGSIEVQSDFILLTNYNILLGVYTNVDNDDDWPMIFNKILASDLVIFATTVYGGATSLRSYEG